MRLAIWDGKPQEDGVTYLRLIEAEPNHIMLTVVDGDGKCLLDPDAWDFGGVLLTVTANGTISLSPCVMPSLGFALDRQGRVKLDEFAERMAAKNAQKFGGKRASFQAIEGGAGNSPISNATQS